ncbi:MAG: ATP--guanido phosphotransferase, partial [Gimesia chilikensis]
MNLDAFTRTSGEWLRGIGPDSDIVMSSRIRLARNLAQFPFINRCTESTLGEIEQLMRPIITNLPMQEKLSYLNVNKLSNLDRQFIVERQMISREHAERS